MGLQPGAVVGGGSRSGTTAGPMVKCSSAPNPVPSLGPGMEPRPAAEGGARSRAMQRLGPGGFCTKLMLHENHQRKWYTR